MTGFSGKTFIVTGGSSGIGRAIVRKLTDSGATVLNLDRTAPDAGNPLEQHYEIDLADTAQISALFDQISTSHPVVHGAVNNAGLTIKGAFASFPQNDVDLLLDVNLRAVFLCCQRQLRLIANGGSVVNLGSIHTNASTPESIAYAATKGGILAMTHGLAFEFGKRGIRVNTLSPGLVRTEHVADWLAQDPAAEKKTKDTNALGRVTTPDEVADVAAFLLSDASRAITGTNIEMDQAAGKLLTAEVETL